MQTWLRAIYLALMLREAVDIPERAGMARRCSGEPGQKQQPTRISDAKPEGGAGNLSYS